MSLTMFSWNLTKSRTLVLIRLVVIDSCWTSGVLFVRALFVGALFVVCRKILEVLRYFPRRSNQTNQLFLEGILLKSKEASCSFEGDVTTEY